MAYFKGPWSFSQQWLLYLRFRERWVTHRNNSRDVVYCFIILGFHSSISFVFVCVCVVCEGVLMSGSELEARNWGQGSSSSLFHIYFLRQDLSLSLEFTGLVRILGNELQASACPSTPPQCWGSRHELESLGSTDENSSLHMCRSTLHLPSPKLRLKQK